MDKYQSFSDGPGLAGRDFFAVTKSDSTDYISDAVKLLPKALYIGGFGDVAVQALDGTTTVTFKNVPAGTVLPIRPRKVMNATTATDIVAII